MSKQFKVSYYLRSNYKNKEGKTPLMARMYVDNNSTIASTGINIEEKLWNAKTGHLKGRTQEALSGNLQIDQYTSRLHALFNRLYLADSELTVGKFKAALAGKSSEDIITLLQTAEKYNENFRIQVGITRKKSTLGKYETTKTRLKDFIQFKYGRDDIRLNELNYEFVSGFDLFLKTTRSCKPNTVARFMRRFKTIVIFARNSGYLHYDPFANFIIRMEREDRGYLTDEELKKILNKKLHSERLERVRDIFIFACFTGLAYIDVKQLTTHNLIQENGSYWINTKREKTDVRSNIVLLDIPMQLIKKYEPLRVNEHLFPVPSNQKVNDYLKEIADICQINKNLTFHLARHSFATTVTLSKGVPIETVSRMLGHTNIKTTQIYARVTTNKIQNDMNILAGKLNELNYQSTQPI